jgi:hypothetical protein
MKLSTQQTQSTRTSNHRSGFQGSGTLDALMQAAGSVGFKELRRLGNQESLMECAGLRLRLSASDGRLRVEGLFPRTANLAEFLLEVNDAAWWTGIQNGVIIRRCDTSDFSLAIDAIHSLHSTAAITNAEDGISDNSWLRPLGHRPWLSSVPASWAELGRAILSRTRSLLVKGTMSDLWSWLAAVVPAGACYMIRSEKIQAETEKAATLLRESSGINGVCYVVNLGCLPNDAWRYYYINELFVDLSLSDACSGTRVIFLDTSVATVPPSLPVINLPDFAAANPQLMPDDKGIRIVLDRGGALNQNQADKMLKAAKRSTDYGPVHGVSVVRRNRSVNIQPDRVAVWKEKLETGFSEVVGHTEIKAKLALDIALWMARGNDSGPLILAFVGPSGVGKNMLAGALATVMADPAFMDLKTHKYVPINLGVPGDEKQWSLKGVGVGHVGANQRGLLESATEFPGFVISFDEIDKGLSSGSDPQRFLLEIFESNGFRNGHGHWVEFRKGIFIVTLNRGMDAAGEVFKPIGFGSSDHSKRAVWVSENYRNYYNQHVLAPLRGRIHQTYFFGELNEQDLRRLVGFELNRIKAEHRSMGWGRHQTDLDKAIDDIIAASDPTQGARGLMEQIDRFQENLIAKLFQTSSKTRRKKSKQGE